MWHEGGQEESRPGGGQLEDLRCGWTERPRYVSSTQTLVAGTLQKLRPSWKLWFGHHATLSLIITPCKTLFYFYLLLGQSM